MNDLSLESSLFLTRSLSSECLNVPKASVRGDWISVCLMRDRLLKRLVLLRTVYSLDKPLENKRVRHLPRKHERSESQHQHVRERKTLIAGAALSYSQMFHDLMINKQHERDSNESITALRKT